MHLPCHHPLGCYIVRSMVVGTTAAGYRRWQLAVGNGRNACCLAVDDVVVAVVDDPAAVIAGDDVIVVEVSGEHIAVGFAEVDDVDVEAGIDVDVVAAIDVDVEAVVDVDVEAAVDVAVATADVSTSQL